MRCGNQTGGGCCAGDARALRRRVRFSVESGVGPERPRDAQAIARGVAASLGGARDRRRGSPVLRDDLGAAHSGRRTVQWASRLPGAAQRVREVKLAFVGVDGRPHTGKMIVNAAVTEDVIKVFRTLYHARFPIRRMEPVDAFHRSDTKSMAATTPRVSTAAMR